MMKKNTSKLIKKLGITFVIPFLMLIFGIILILSTSWEVITYGLDFGSVIFSKPAVVVKERQFKINDKYINRPGVGEEFGTLKIPNLNFEEPVYHGDTQIELKKGIGHFAGSTLPGEGGNIILAGHRHTVFRPLQNIKVDDEIIFETSYGTYKYKVSKIKVVNNKDNSELRVLDDERLTMYTCYPFSAIGNTSERMIVICDYIEN